jgi:hypothetical protein
MLINILIAAFLLLIFGSLIKRIFKKDIFEGFTDQDVADVKNQVATLQSKVDTMETKLDESNPDSLAATVKTNEVSINAAVAASPAGAVGEEDTEDDDDDEDDEDPEEDE